MKVYHAIEPERAPARMHPWTVATADERHAYVDFKLEPHRIWTDLEDFTPFASQPAIHEFMELARDIMLTGSDYIMKPEYWVYAAGWSFLTLIVGTVYFWAAEERYGRTD